MPRVLTLCNSLSYNVDVDSPADRKIDRRIARTTERVRAAAVEIAVSEGLAACTMQNIAERAGVARSTIYRHWEGPGELLVEALETLSAAPAPDSIDVQTSAHEVIRSLVAGLAHALNATPWGKLAAELVAASRQDPDLEDLLRRFVRTRLDVATPAIISAQQRGDITADLDPDYLLGLIVGPIYYRHLIARENLDDQWTTAHTDQIYAILTPRAGMSDD